MITLKLVLKKKWYDLIEKGIKREEYREIKDYYTKRFYLNNDGAKVKKFSYVTFYLGYLKKKKRPSMTFRIKSIDVGIGHPEWGAEEGKLYYVIVLGERIE